MPKYALIGKRLDYSYSKLIHEYLFKTNNIQATYDLVELDQNSIVNFLDKVRNNEYLGINVTIPYKEIVIQYLDELTDSAKNIGAVNTIYLKEGKLIGDNTDFIGFIKQLEYYSITPDGKNCFVLGSGGASKAICYALLKMNAKRIQVVSRTNGYNYKDLDKETSIDLLINTTPVGMYPNIDERPVSNEVIDKSKIIVDVIFNPQVTALLKKKNLSYGGLPMLIHQAIASEEKWLNKKINYDFDEIVKLIGEFKNE